MSCISVLNPKTFFFSRICPKVYDVTHTLVQGLLFSCATEELVKEEDQ